MLTRKSISTVLSVLILVSNIGLALNVHYCMGQVSAVSLAYRQNEPAPQTLQDHHKDETKKSCCTAANNDHKSCCDNSHVKLQDKGDSKVLVKSLQLNLGVFCAVPDWKPAPLFVTVATAPQQDTSFYCEAHAPPLFKLYCKYIFYA